MEKDTEPLSDEQLISTLLAENNRLRHAFLYTWSQLGCTKEQGEAWLQKVLDGEWDKCKPTWLSKEFVLDGKQEERHGQAGTV